MVLNEVNSSMFIHWSTCKGPFTVSVCVNVTLSSDTMDFNRTIHSERDANSIAIRVTLTLTLNLTLTVNRP